MVRCMQPWDYAFIRANGDAAACRALFGSDKGAGMGNVFAEPFEAIWRGEFRASSARGTSVCPFYLSNDPPAEPGAFGCWPLKGA